MRRLCRPCAHMAFQQQHMRHNAVIQFPQLQFSTQCSWHIRRRFFQIPEIRAVKVVWQGQRVKASANVRCPLAVICVLRAKRYSYHCLISHFELFLAAGEQQGTPVVSPKFQGNSVNLQSRNNNEFWRDAVSRTDHLRVCAAGKKMSIHGHGIPGMINSGRFSPGLTTRQGSTLNRMATDFLGVLSGS